MPNRVERDLLGQHCDEFGALGTRADKAHFALQHVQELRQLVDAGASQEPANPRYA